jgi:hypothetical protein
MRTCPTLLAFVLTVSAHGLALAEIHEHGGSANALPHEKYVRVVSEAATSSRSWCRRSPRSMRPGGRQP